MWQVEKDKSRKLTKNMRMIITTEKKRKLQIADTYFYE